MVLEQFNWMNRYVYFINIWDLHFITGLNRKKFQEEQNFLATNEGIKYILVVEKSIIANLSFDF